MADSIPFKNRSNRRRYDAREIRLVRWVVCAHLPEHCICGACGSRCPTLCLWRYAGENQLRRNCAGNSFGRKIQCQISSYFYGQSLRRILAWYTGSNTRFFWAWFWNRTKLARQRLSAWKIWRGKAGSSSDKKRIVCSYSSDWQAGRSKQWRSVPEKCRIKHILGFSQWYDVSWYDLKGFGRASHGNDSGWRLCKSCCVTNAIQWSGLSSV